MTFRAASPAHTVKPEIPSNIATLTISPPFLPADRAMAPGVLLVFDPSLEGSIHVPPYPDHVPGDPGSGDSPEELGAVAVLVTDHPSVQAVGVADIVTGMVERLFEVNQVD
jgi:hypothetical protein